MLGKVMSETDGGQLVVASDTGIETRLLDVLALVSRNGVRSVLEQLIVWKHSTRSLLILKNAAAPTVALTLSAVPSSSSAPPPHRAANAGLPVDADMRSAVESVIEAGASTFCIDYLSRKLRSVETEDTIDIGLDMVRQFISAGVLVQVGETEFGEPEYAFQWCAISWTRGSDITTGAQALCSHIDLSRPLSNQKLSLILYMHSVGWITEGGLLNRLHSTRLLMLQGTRGCFQK